MYIFYSPRSSQQTQLIADTPILGVEFLPPTLLEAFKKCASGRRMGDCEAWSPNYRTWVFPKPISKFLSSCLDAAVQVKPHDQYRILIGGGPIPSVVYSLPTRSIIHKSKGVILVTEAITTHKAKLENCVETAHFESLELQENTFHKHPSLSLPC